MSSLSGSASQGASKRPRLGMSFRSRPRTRYKSRVLRQKKMARGYVLQNTQRRKPYRAYQLPPPEIHQSTIKMLVPWPDLPVNPVNPDFRLTRVPGPFERAYKGIDSDRFTGNRIFRKNLTMNMSITFDREMTNTAQPQLRIAAGYCKRPLWVELASSVASGELPNGFQANGQAGQLTEHVDDCIRQTVGRQANFDANGPFPGKDFRMIYDRVHHFTNLSIEDALGDDVPIRRYKKPLSLSFNWEQNKMSTLVGVSSDATPQADMGFQPLNAGEWIPFVTMFWLNYNEFDKANARPTIRVTENQYFLDI